MLYMQCAWLAAANREYGAYDTLRFKSCWK